MVAKFATLQVVGAGSGKANGFFQAADDGSGYVQIGGAAGKGAGQTSKITSDKVGWHIETKKKGEHHKIYTYSYDNQKIETKERPLKIAPTSGYEPRGGDHPVPTVSWFLTEEKARVVVEEQAARDEAVAKAAAAAETAAAEAAAKVAAEEKAAADEAARLKAEAEVGGCRSACARLDFLILDMHTFLSPGS